MATVLAAHRNLPQHGVMGGPSPLFCRNLRVPIYDTSGCTQNEARRFYLLLLRDVITGSDLLGVFLSLGRHLYPYAFCRAVLQNALLRHPAGLEADWIEVQASRVTRGGRQYYMLGRDSLREKSDLDLGSEVSEAGCVLLHVLCAAWLAADDNEYPLDFIDDDDDDDDVDGCGNYEFPMPTICWSLLNLIRKSMLSRLDREDNAATATTTAGPAGLDNFQRQLKESEEKTAGNLGTPAGQGESASGADGGKTSRKDALGAGCREARCAASCWNAVAREVWEFLPLEAVGRAFGRLVARGDPLAFLLRRNLLLASLRQDDWRAPPYAAAYDFVWHADVRRMTRANCRALGLGSSGYVISNEMTSSLADPNVIDENVMLDTDMSDEVTPEENRSNETNHSKEATESPSEESRRSSKEKVSDQSPGASSRNSSEDNNSPGLERQDSLFLPVFSEGEEENQNNPETSTSRRRAGRRKRRRGRKLSSVEPNVFRDVSPSLSVSSSEKVLGVSQGCSAPPDERSAAVYTSLLLKENAAAAAAMDQQQEQSEYKENLEGTPGKGKSICRGQSFKKRNRRSRASTSPNDNEEKEKGKARSGKSKASRRRKVPKDSSGKNRLTSQNEADVTSNKLTSPKPAKVVSSKYRRSAGEGDLGRDFDRDLVAALESAPRCQAEVDGLLYGEMRMRDKPRRWSKSRAHFSRNVLSLEAETAGRQV